MNDRSPLSRSIRREASSRLVGFGRLRALANGKQLLMKLLGDENPLLLKLEIVAVRTLIKDERVIFRARNFGRMPFQMQ